MNLNCEKINNNIYNEDNKNELNDINKVLVTEVEQKEEEKNSKKSEDSLLKYLSSNKRVSEEDIKNSNLILIEEEKNCNLLNGKKLLINAGGLIEGGRKESDGIVIFSLKRNKKDIQINLFNKVKVNSILNCINPGRFIRDMYKVYKENNCLDLFSIIMEIILEQIVW